MKIYLLVSFLLLVVTVGCQTVKRGAEEVGKPLGSAMETMGGMTEGAQETYSDQEGENPYNR